MVNAGLVDPGAPEEKGRLGAGGSSSPSSELKSCGSVGIAGLSRGNAQEKDGEPSLTTPEELSPGPDVVVSESFPASCSPVGGRT